MWTIVKKDILGIFSVPSGVLALALFYLVSLLFLWVFESPFNIINSGFADLNVFFNLAPWLLMFLIPALSMRSFAEEIKSGTLEVLLTKPISVWQLVLGKFMAIVVVFTVALLPTTIHLWGLQKLMQVGTQLDWGSIVGGYLGLVFLCICFACISNFASAASKNAVTAYLGALLLCFLQYYGWGQLAELIPDFGWFGFIRDLGIEAHYIGISNGVVQVSDLAYYIGLSLFFLNLTQRALQKIKAQ